MKPTSFFNKNLQPRGTAPFQKGGTLLGLIIGLVLGLALALVVAMYVTKVPVPFANKGQSRTADQDAAEAKKNKNWDPNAPLYGKVPAKPADPAASAPSGPASSSAAGAPPPAATPSTQAPAPALGTNPARPEPKGADAKATETKTSEKVESVTPAAGSIGEAARAKSSAGAVDPFVYFVQAGAYRAPEDAEAQRARLQLGGFEAKVTEREQSGRPIFRVRVGPFDRKDDADKAKERMDATGLDTAMVRVQR